MNNPILDLSYRNYDGPLKNPRFRWWVIAKNGILLATKKKSLWLLMGLASWYYIVMVVVLIFLQQIAGGSGGASQGFTSFVSRLDWGDQFLHGFSFAQFPLMLLGLLLGAGAIANDHRANALLVYLSKPCTKLDYLIGKWMGVFLPTLVILLIPNLLFYGYGALTFREFGFLKDPWLLPKVILIVTVGSAFIASLVIGVSSIFRQGWQAGVAYAAIYFITNFFTKLMQLAFVSSRGDAPTAVDTLFYASIDGINIGWAKAVLQTEGSAPFGANVTSFIGVPAPPLWGALLVILVISALSLGIAWTKIRAVEVIGK